MSFSIFGRLPFRGIKPHGTPKASCARLGDSLYPGRPLRVYLARQIHSNAQKWSFRVGETPIYEIQSEFHSSVFGGPFIRVYLAAVRVYLAAVRVYLADRSSVFGERSSVFGESAVRVYLAGVVVCIPIITHQRVFCAVTTPHGFHRV